MSYIRFHLKFWPFIIFLSVLLITVGGYYAMRLKIDSDLKALLPQKSETVRNMDIINPKASSGNDLRIVVYGGSLEKRIEAAKAFREFLEAQPELVRNVRFTTPKVFFEKHKYQLIPMHSLEEIHEEVKEKRRKYSDVTDPLGLEAVIDKEEAEKKIENSAADVSEEQKKQNLDEAKHFLDQLDDMRPYYMTADGDYLVIRVIPFRESLSMKSNRKTMNMFKEQVKKFDFSRFDPQMKADVFGKLYDNLERYDSILGDISFGGWGIVFIFVIVVIYFRSFWSLFILFPPLLAGMATGTGAVAILEEKLNIIAIFLVLVVFGVGIEFGIHLLARMLQERKTKDVEQALSATWASTGRATITSAVALLSGFALLTLSHFQGFAQFGRVAIVLVTATAGSFLFFTPSWMIAAEKLRKFKSWRPSLADSVWEIAKRNPTKKLPFQKQIRFITYVLILVAIPLAAMFFRFDYTYKESTKNLFHSPSRDSLSTAFNGEALKPAAVALFPSEEQAFKFIQTFDQAKSQYPDIKEMRGLSSFLPLDQEQRIAKLQEISDDIEYSWLDKIEDEQIRKAIKGIKDTAYDLEPYTFKDIPPEIREAFTASDKSDDQIVFIYDIGGPTDGRKSMRFQDSLKNFMNKYDFHPIVSGQELIFADVVRTVTEEGPWLVLGMFVLVFVICWLDFKKMKYSIVTLSPVLFGFLMTALVMVAMNMDINFFNMVAIASLGAMVVDNSIHLFHRFLEFKDEGEPNPVRMAAYAVAPSVIACTGTSICGYFGMVVANHSGVASLGLVATIGLLCCLFSSIFFFPAWISLFEKDEIEENQKQTIAS